MLKHLLSQVFLSLQCNDLPHLLSEADTTRPLAIPSQACRNKCPVTQGVNISTHILLFPLAYPPGYGWQEWCSCLPGFGLMTDWRLGIVDQQITLSNLTHKKQLVDTMGQAGRGNGKETLVQAVTEKNTLSLDQSSQDC